MKRTTLLFFASISLAHVYGQETDSLQVASPEVNESLIEEVAADSSILMEDTTIIPEAEVSKAVQPSDTVFIREVIYDTVYADQPYDDRYLRKRGRKDEIRTLSGRLGHSGGFGAVSFRSSKFRGETIVMAGLRGGWIINRSLAIGLEGHGLIPTAKFQGLSQYEAVLVGGYGGLFLEPIFFSNQVVHVTFPVAAGSGWIGYHEDFDEGNFESPELITGDVFWYVEPGANVEFNLARSFRLALGVSKRFTQDLQLRDTSSSAFDKINYYLTLKIGSF